MLITYLFLRVIQILIWPTMIRIVFGHLSNRCVVKSEKKIGCLCSKTTEIKKQPVKNQMTVITKVPSSSIIEEEDSSFSSRMDEQSCDGEAAVKGRSCSRLFSIPFGRTRYKKIQSYCYNFLERPCGPLSVSYHLTVFGLVVVGLVLAVLETMDNFKDAKDFKFWIYILEIFLLVLFSLEYILRMWSAGCRSTYVGLLGRLRFAMKPFVIVDLVVIGSTSAFILMSPRSNLSSAISILRFFQVLRMIRFDRQGGSWKLLGSVLFLHKQELMTTFYIGFCSLIFASFFVYQAEKGVNEEEFGTFADSFWWGVVTLTTVGYGDKVPVSWAGRGVAAFFAIMGISFFALPAGILGSGFALKVSQQQRQKHAKRRRRPAAMLIQCNWRYYASRKDSKSIATWLPYVRYLQETNARKDEAKEVNSSEKPVHNIGRTRKISLFGRRPPSGPSPDILSKSEANSVITMPDHLKSRRKKSSFGNGLFPSIDSLHDGHSCSMLDQHTDDEHGGNSLVRSVIIVTDVRGNPSLPPAYKQGIRFTRYLKFLVALRKFKLAKKPYDVKDVIEQYSTGHVELLGKVKGIAHKIDEALGYKVGTEKINETPMNSRTNLVLRLSKLEKQVKTLDLKLDKVISLMEKSVKKDHPAKRNLSDGGTVSWCSLCGQNSSNVCESHGSPTALQTGEEHKTPHRKRKIALMDSKPKVSEIRDNLGEQGTLMNREEQVLWLTTEDPNQVMNLNKNPENHTLKDFDQMVKTGLDYGNLSENHLSPKPFTSECYDLRTRSDSAIYSVCSEHKENNCSSVGVSLASSDSEYAPSKTTIVETPMDMNQHVVHETRM